MTFACEDIHRGGGSVTYEVQRQVSNGILLSGDCNPISFVNDTKKTNLDPHIMINPLLYILPFPIMFSEDPRPFIFLLLLKFSKMMMLH